MTFVGLHGSIPQKQIIFFCASILGEEPDPSMIKQVDEEIEDWEEEGGQELGDNSS